MMGPTTDRQFTLADSNDIVWLTGYKVEVLGTDSISNLSPEFMCHNNLNIKGARNFPWEEGVFSYTNRVFTLTQGFLDLQLPDGFGIPFPGDQNLEVMFQALNHNLSDIDTSLIHRVTLTYFLESEIDFKLNALAQHTIWLVKQYSGPPGVYGEKPTYDWKDTAEVEQYGFHKAQQPTCGVDMLANNPMKDLDMYYDQHGRKFTGHWKIRPGRETITFDATKMLNLKQDKRLYYATAHVHPYCEYLELIDKTSGKSVFKAEANSFGDRIGLKTISDFTSREGILLNKDHHYQLLSDYNNTGKDTLSAMSVLYLYLDQ